MGSQETSFLEDLLTPTAWSTTEMRRHYEQQEQRARFMACLKLISEALPDSQQRSKASRPKDLAGIHAFLWAQAFVISVLNVFACTSPWYLGRMQHVSCAHRCNQVNVSSVRSPY
ncbi:uncharacterized protein LOC142587437 isoform X2 [Dermacentor variabilis]|uniref:uncharacterized protein LOC142587437 isoform X2 n=1 Tax=Dermacentor variabilis TaxID=34621 RepID=UPI003F5B7BC5